jgi:hypothetical protein
VREEQKMKFWQYIKRGALHLPPLTPTKLVAWFLKKADNFEHVANGPWQISFSESIVIRHKHTDHPP